MIKKKYHTVDVKGWYHIQRSCILSDELKLKHNEKKKLNEWNKNLFSYL
jgi:hypothetical protein